MLFKPFKELRKKENISQVENNSIGIGLTNSKEICTELGGKLELISSVKGLTVF
jgi:signal transduction histidine kinase